MVDVSGCRLVPRHWGNADADAGQGQNSSLLSRIDYFCWKCFSRVAVMNYLVGSLKALFIQENTQMSLKSPLHFYRSFKRQVINRYQMLEGFPTYPVTSHDTTPNP
jgi:hypothetical protein